MTSPREWLAFAADVPLPDAERLYAELAPFVGFVKVGLSLFVEHGPRAVEVFRARGAKVFLDLKLHDIPNTVELAARRAGALGVSLLTVHAAGGEAMMRAAVTGARAGAAEQGLPPPRILAVTALTSLSDVDVASIGAGASASAWATVLAALAAKAGVDGLVCSPHEAKALRRSHPQMFLCTPGIRPGGSAAGDQARVETPRAAREAGSDLLVIGRPLSQAGAPADAARAILRELEGG